MKGLLGVVLDAVGARWIPLVLAAVVLVAAWMLHHRVASRAIEQAVLGERLQWQELSRRAELRREEERQAAQAKITSLETEASSLQGDIEAREAELEQVIHSHESGAVPGASSPMLSRDLVRELNRQGR